jgi:hypothetical protein
MIACETFCLLIDSAVRHVLHPGDMINKPNKTDETGIGGAAYIAFPPSRAVQPRLRGMVRGPNNARNSAIGDRLTQRRAALDA